MEKQKYEKKMAPNSGWWRKRANETQKEDLYLTDIEALFYVSTEVERTFSILQGFDLETREIGMDLTEEEVKSVRGR